MARKTNKEQVLTLAAQLGVEVEYGQMGEEGFEVALYGYAAHLAFDPMGEGHTAITNQAGTGARTEARIWGMALADLKDFVPCGEDCHCRADAFDTHFHNLTGDPSAADADMTPCDELPHCPSVCDCPAGTCTALTAPVATLEPEHEPEPQPVMRHYVIANTETQRGMTMFYIAGWNMPGYLPDTDLAVFETEGEATHYLISEIDSFWDEDYLAGDSHEVADERWADIHASLQYETAPYSVQNGDGSLTFWVTIVPKSDLPYTAEGN